MVYLRKNIRLKGFDYSSPGYYFVTICTKGYAELFSPRVSSRYGHALPPGIRASDFPEEFHARSRIIEDKLGDIERKFPCNIDFYCIMPTHIHKIVFLHQQSKPFDEFDGCQSLSTSPRVKLETIISAFKSWTGRALGSSAFQPKYYDHIIREEKVLKNIREYILRNPYALSLRWNELEKL